MLGEAKEIVLFPWLKVFYLQLKRSLITHFKFSTMPFALIYCIFDRAGWIFNFHSPYNFSKGIKPNVEAKRKLSSQNFQSKKKFDGKL